MDHRYLVWSKGFQAWLFSATTCYESEATIHGTDRFQAWLFLATTANECWSERNTHRRKLEFCIFGESERITERISFRHGSFRPPRITSLER